MNAMNASFEATIDQHLAAYCDGDSARRAAAVARTWCADGRLVDPPLQSRGHDGISAQAEALLSQFPGHSFRRCSGIDQHNGFARYEWQLCNAEGQAVVQGCDFAEFDDSGRLRQVVGFFGPLPAVAAA